MPSQTQLALLLFPGSAGLVSQQISTNLASTRHLLLWSPADFPPLIQSWPEPSQSGATSLAVYKQPQQGPEYTPKCLWPWEDGKATTHVKPTDAPAVH